MHKIAFLIWISDIFHVQIINKLNPSSHNRAAVGQKLREIADKFDIEWNSPKSPHDLIEDLSSTILSNDANQRQNVPKHPVQPTKPAPNQANPTNPTLSASRPSHHELPAAVPQRTTKPEPSIHEAVTRDVDMSDLERRFAALTQGLRTEVPIPHNSATPCKCDQKQPRRNTYPMHASTGQVAYTNRNRNSSYSPYQQQNRMPSQMPQVIYPQSMQPMQPIQFHYGRPRQQQQQYVQPIRPMQPMQTIQGQIAQPIQSIQPIQPVQPIQRQYVPVPTLPMHPMHRGSPVQRVPPPPPYPQLTKPHKPTQPLQSTMNHQSDYESKEFLDCHLGWTPKEVVQWMVSIENGMLKAYERRLLKNVILEDVDGTSLVDLDVNDLHRLGVVKLHHKKVLMAHLLELTKLERPITSHSSLPTVTSQSDTTPRTPALHRLRPVLPPPETSTESRRSVERDDSPSSRALSALRVPTLSDEPSLLSPAFSQLRKNEGGKKYQRLVLEDGDRENSIFLKSSEMSDANSETKQETVYHNANDNKDESQMEQTEDEKEIPEMKHDASLTRNPSLTQNPSLTLSIKSVSDHGPHFESHEKSSDGSCASWAVPGLTKSMMNLFLEDSESPTQEFTFKNGIVSVLVEKATNIDQKDDDQLSKMFGETGWSDPYVMVCDVICALMLLPFCS